MSSSAIGAAVFLTASPAQAQVGSLGPSLQTSTSGPSLQVSQPAHSVSTSHPALAKAAAALQAHPALKAAIVHAVRAHK
jgi:hypothetical protein